MKKTNTLSLLTRICNNSPINSNIIMADEHTIVIQPYNRIIQSTRLGLPKSVKQTARAVRCLVPKSVINPSEDRLYTCRTHDIELMNNSIYFSNNNSTEWDIEFESNELAKQFWDNNIKTPVNKI